MFIRLFIILFSVVALSGFANAAPAELELDVRQEVSQCNTGEVHCCDSTYSSASTFVTGLFGLLGLPPPTINVGGTQVVGISCSPTTVDGTGSGSSCTQQPVCCTGNTFNGVINIGCAPITINL